MFVRREEALIVPPAFDEREAARFASGVSQRIHHVLHRHKNKQRNNNEQSAICCRLEECPLTNPWLRIPIVKTLLLQKNLTERILVHFKWYVFKIKKATFKTLLYRHHPKVGS